MKKLNLALLLALIIVLSTGCKTISEKDHTTDTLPIIKSEVSATFNPSMWSLSDTTTTQTETTEIETLSTTVAEGKETAVIVEAATRDVVTPTSTTVAETITVPETSAAILTTEYIEPTTTAPRFTIKSISETYMFVTKSVNVRTEPDTSGKILFTLDKNERVYAVGVCNETGWYQISMEGQLVYISNLFLSNTQVIEESISQTEPKELVSGFVYYKVGDASPSYELEHYLYEQLSSRGISWWYPYAVAQIWQESRWNPQSTNGRDHGICQFKGIYWENRAAAAGLPGADIWNPYHSLYVYAWYISMILSGSGNNVGWSLSFYITGNSGEWHQRYVDLVMEWYHSLKAS